MSRRSMSQSNVSSWSAESRSEMIEGRHARNTSTGVALSPQLGELVRSNRVVQRVDGE
jgi:hypothetical protein